MSLSDKLSVFLAEEITAKFKMRPTPPAKKGMWDGWSIAKLRAEATKVKSQMQKHKGKVPANLRSRFSQIMFAIRAKQGTRGRKGKHWGHVTARSAPGTKWCIKMRDEDGTQFWDGSGSWIFSKKHARKYNTEEEANKVANKLLGKNIRTVGSPTAIPCNANVMLANDSHLLINGTLLIRLMEWAREDAPDDDSIHVIVEKMMDMNESDKHGKEFTMEDADPLGIAG